MNNPTNQPEHFHPDAPGPSELPADLAAIAEQLDLLGEHEKACAPAAFEARIVEASRIALVSGKMDQLGEAERQSAPAHLEPRVHEASRHELPTAPRLKLVGQRADHPQVAVSWRTWGMRIAAAVALSAAGIAAYMATRPTNPAPGSSFTTGPGGTTPTLASNNGALDKSVEDTVFALLASIDSATMGEQMENLAREADGLSTSTLSDPPLATRLIEGAL